MSTILKLGISGIRSFGERDLECITFDSPVTLIVGCNGAGKTTIIECLKMASTGILPPNCSGGKCFVHDPKVSNVPEVKGQIRMLFRQTNGAEMVAIRSFQLTRLKDADGKPKLTYKALESVLKTGTGENRQSLSQRCADMDVKVPQAMNVSRAILENVIFCHQEESNWPLQEQSVLKKKFDAIFGATRYTKALKEVEAVKSRTSLAQKEKAAQVDILLIHLEQANALRKRQDALKANELEQERELAEVGMKIDVANRNHAEAVKNNEKYTAMALELEKTKEMEKNCRDRQAAQQRNVEMLGLTSSQLQEELATMGTRQMAAENEHRQEGIQVETLEKNLAAIENEREKMRNNLEQVVAASTVIENHKKKQRTLWREWDIGGEFGPGSMQDVRDHVSMKRDILNQDRQKREEEERRLGRCAGASEEDLKKRKLEHDTVVGTCDEISRDIARISTELNEFLNVDANFEKIRADIQAMGDNGNDGKLEEIDQQLHKIEREKSSLHFDIERKQESVRQLEYQSEQLAEIDVLQKQAHEVDAMIIEHKRKLPPGDAPEAIDSKNLVGIRQRIEGWLNGEKRKLEDARKTVQASRIEVSGVEAQIGCLIREEQQLKTQIEEKEREIGKLTLQDAESMLKNAVAKHGDTMKTDSNGRAYSEVLDVLLDKSHHRGACALCTRPFQGSELSTFDDSVKRMKETVQRSKSGLDHASAVRDAQAEVEHKRHQLTLVHACMTQKQQLITVSSRREPLEDSLRQAKSKADHAGNEERTLANLVSQGEAWRSFAEELERLETDVANKHKTIGNKRSMLVDLSQAGASLGEEREALQRLVEEREKLSKKIETLRTDHRMLTQQKYAREKQKMELQREASLLQEKVERRKRLLAEREKLEHNGFITKAPLPELKSAMEDAERKYNIDFTSWENYKKSLNEHIHEKDKEMFRVENFQKEMTELQAEIERGEARLKHAEGDREKLVKIDQAVIGCKNQINSSKVKVQAAAKELDRLMTHRWVVEKNLEVQRIGEELANYAQKRLELEQVGAVDLGSLRQAVTAASQAEVELRELRASRKGALDEIRRQFDIITKQLENTMYDDIGEKHRYAVLDNEIALLAIQDLTKYIRALDKALMKYHLAKMTDINKLVRDMWRQVYRGRDIEYIQIRSDADDPHQSGDVVRAGSRSHNYRVVMINAHTNTELDMRGRCSAGQKVLASLIIRLALADAFGCECGVLCLDEPTTNLDTHNIQSLAEALGELIKVRSINSGFQLMIITHDEQFVSMLAQHQVCDRYWRVSKNPEGHSKITSDDIRRLMG